MDEFSDGKAIFAVPQQEIVWSRTDDPTKWEVSEQPIGWITEDYRTDKSATTYSAETAQRWLNKGWPIKPLYTEPPKREWVGLTDEELKPLCDEWWIIFGAHVNMFAREIESKLKEKNCG